MDRETIIRFLKEHPNFTIGRAAYALKVPEMEITSAQKWTLRNIPRNSPAWGLQNGSVIKK